MSCMTLFAQETAVATTQLTRIASHEFCTSWRVEEKTEHEALRMSWVVVTDEHGNRELRSVWNVAEQGLEAAWSRNEDQTELSQTVDEGKALA